MVPSEAAYARRAIFLDRDGVININRSDYVKNWEEFVPIPGSYEAIRRLVAGFAVVVVTNQSAVNRGLLSREMLEDIHRRMLDQVLSAGGRIDALYVCPHRPEEGCPCRKPRTALIERAIAELGLARNGSYLIGDSMRDLEAGRAAGLRTVLIAPCGPAPEFARYADWVVETLAQAAEVLTAGSIEGLTYRDRKGS